MKKETLWLLINTAILLVVGIVLVVVIQQRVPKNPEDKLFNQIAILKNETKVEGVPSQSGFSVIDYKAELYSKKGQFLATVYNVKIKNTYTVSNEYDFGMIELLVAINEKNQAYVEVVYLNQSDWTIKGVQKYIYEYYNGVTMEQIENIPKYDAADINAGATAVDSTGTIKDLVLKVMKLHLNIENDPYLTIFGPDYTLTTDASFEQTYHVLAREIAKDAGRNDIGYVYKLNGIGVAQDGQAEKELTFYVALDKEQKILGIISPEEEYKHSSGGFRNVTLALMESLVGLSLNDIDTDYDVTGGATNTGQLVIDLLVALKEVAFEEITTDPYAQIFGKDYTKTEDNDFEKTDHILRKEDVVNESNELIGYVYQLRDVVENFKPEEFNPITIYVILDKENKILGILAPEAEYEHTLGERYDKVLGNIELLVGEKLEDIEDGEYDFVSGVTNTTGLVIDLLIELKEVLLP